MDSYSRETSREENLNDSWVDLHFQQQQQQQQSSYMAPTSQPIIHSGVATPEIRPPGPMPGLCTGQMEKLLLEAQRESRGSSRYSSQPSSTRGSPKSPHSPNNEVAPPCSVDVPPIQEGQVLQAVQKANIPTDWIWDWSSRPEAMPHHNNGAGSDVSSNGGGGRPAYQHPPRRSRVSVRNSPVMRSSAAGIMDNLSTLLVTHACSFLLGAAAMFLYLKKYCNWTPPIQTPAIMD